MKFTGKIAPFSHFILPSILLVNFWAFQAAYASNRVLAVANPVVEIGLADKSDRALWIAWMRDRLNSELAKNKNVTVRDQKDNSGQRQQIVDFMVLSQLTLIGHNAIPANALKSKEPCSVSVDLRLVTFSDSSILGAATARNDKAKWPGFPDGKVEDISKSKLARMIDPLIKKASASLLKSFK